MRARLGTTPPKLPSSASGTFSRKREKGRAAGCCFGSESHGYVRGTALADERILDFHSDITVAADASMEVAETIRVRAEGDQIRHGIYRDFPTEYRDRYGNRVHVEFEPEGVTRDGADEPFHTEGQVNGVRVYFGSEDTLLSTRRIHLRVALSHDAPARILRRSRRAVLERHRQRLGFSDRCGERRGRRCPARSRRRTCTSKRTRASKARKGKTTARARTRLRTRSFSTTRALAPREGLTDRRRFSERHRHRAGGVGTRALVPARQRRRARRRHRPAADVGLLPVRVVARRPRSETRRDHPAVRGAGGLHAGHAAPRRAHGLRQPLLRGRRRRSRACAATLEIRKTAAVHAASRKRRARAMRCRTPRQHCCEATLGSRSELELEAIRARDDRRGDQGASRRAREERRRALFQHQRQARDSRARSSASPRCCSGSSRTARARCSPARVSCWSGSAVWSFGVFALVGSVDQRVASAARHRHLRVARCS